MIQTRPTLARRLCLFLTAFLLTPAIAGGQDATPLTLQETYDRELAADTSHAFSIDLAVGEYVFGEVFQRSVDVVVTLAGPDAETIGSFDQAARGPEPFEFEARDSGIHTIRVAPFRNATGRYVIRLKRVEQSDGSPKQQVERLMLVHEGDNRPGGVIGVIRAGEVIFTRAYGMADLTHGLPNTRETLFNIGSVSKQFTGVAFAILAAHDSLSLDDDVRTYLPELPDFGTEVTVRHLFNHTSGYREVYGVLALEGRHLDGDILRRTDALEVVKRQPALQFEPGSEFVYNSTGYVLLTEIAERVTGVPFPDWMADRVFEPLEMGSTIVQRDWGEVIPGAATSYIPSADGSYRDGTPHLAYYGATDVWTNVYDLAKWLRIFNSGELAGVGVIDRMTERSVLTSGDTLHYTMGLYFDRHLGHDRIYHGGVTGGYRAFLAYYPDLDAGVVVLGNSLSVDCPRIADQAAAAFFPDRSATLTESTPSVQTVQVPSDILDRYTGEFTVLGPGQLVRFTRSESGLVFHREGAADRSLRAVDEFTFVHDESHSSISFHVEADGTVNRATITQYGRDYVVRRGKPWRPSPEELAGYTGRFFSEEAEAFYSVSVEDGVLTMHHRHVGDVPLRAKDKDLFGGSWPFVDVAFVRNDGGTITGFTVSEPRMRNVLFRKLDTPQ